MTVKYRTSALVGTDPHEATRLLARSLEIAEPLGLELLLLQARRALAIAHDATGHPSEEHRVIIP